MAKFGLSNIRYQNQESKELHSLGVGVENIELTSNEPEESEKTRTYLTHSYDGIEITIRAKRHGNFIEQYLYYKWNKKKRIRKKYMQKYWNIFGIEITKDWYLHRK